MKARNRWYSLMPSCNANGHHITVPVIAGLNQVEEKELLLHHAASVLPNPSSGTAA